MLRSRTWVALVGLGLLLRLAVVRLTPGYVPKHDDHSYLMHAVALVNTGAYPVYDVRGLDIQTAYRAPGFPVVLATARALLGPELSGARVVQVLIGALVVALVGVVARQLWGPRTALVATAIAAVSPLLVIYDASLISEPLFVALELAAVACALHAHGRTGWAVAAGLLAGAGALTRPIGLFLLFALALCAGGRRAALAMIAAGLLAIAPWTIRNFDTMHAFVPISTEAGNTLAGTYNDVSAKDGRWRDPRLTRLYRRERAATRHNEVARDAALTHAVARWIAHHPLQPAKVAVLNAGRIAGIAPTAYAAHSLVTVSLPTRPAWLVRVGLLLVTALALAGLFTKAARRAPPGWWLAGGLLLASTVLVNAEQRFAVPLTAWLIPLAALPLTRGA
ncbi:MAG: glycosyltransferase family 39 protein [Solirubrobacteraceae bacterium]